MKAHLHLTRRFGRTVLAATLALAIGFTSTVFADPGQGKGKGHDNGKAKGKSADWVPPGHRRAPVEVVVKAAPPPLQKEAPPARPSPAHLWVAGYWDWQGDAYAWTAGTWMLPPEPQTVWVAPRYEQRSGVSIYISGFWKL